ncbi:MAG TPA: hypothetical protein VJL28_02470 [Gemmatimonadaceae bacterium]|nr:hypothetical protein [Gemmatimonadaceae bacterium]
MAITSTGVSPMLISARLAQKLRESFGDEAAEEMVDWMHRIDSERSHLRELNEANFARYAALLREQFAEHRQETRADIAELSQEMRAGFAELRQEMRAGFAKAHDETAQLEVKFERRFNDMMRYSLLFWVTSLGTVVALLTLR